MDGDQGVEEGPDGQGDLPPVVAAGEDDDPNLEESEMDESLRQFPSNELVLQQLTQ